MVVIKIKSKDEENIAISIISENVDDGEMEMLAEIVEVLSED